MTKAEIAKTEFPGVPTGKVDEFVVTIQGEPYITASGLQWKMMDQYGVGKFAVAGLIPSVEEYDLLRRMMNLDDDDPLVVVRGEVWIKGFDKPFVDYGTASKRNLKGFVKFSEYPLEMATRRATNRAMRLATATGLCSVDEINHPEQAPEEEATPSPEEITLSQFRLYNAIRCLVQHDVFSDEEKQQAESFIQDLPTEEEMRDKIKLLDRIRMSRLAEKEQFDAKKTKGTD